MRKLTVPLLATSLLIGGIMAIPSLMVTTTSVAAQQLGLAERRAVTSYQETVLPEKVKAIQAAAGFEVPVEVKWETLVLSGQADNMKETWYLTDIFFTPTVEGLKKIATDDAGKSALKAKLKKIVIHYDEATAPSSNYAAGLSFSDGVLTLNYKPGSNGASDQVEPRAKALKDFLESKL